MYKICKTEQSACRQRQIAEQMEKMLCHQPYDRITVGGLCQRVGMPRKAFYNYFECKKDILYAIADFSIQEYPMKQRSYKADEPSTLAKELEKFFVICKENRPFLEALLRDGLFGDFIGYLIEKTFSEDFKSKFGFLSDVSESEIRKANLFVVSGLMSLSMDWLARGCVETEQEMVATILRLLPQAMDYAGFDGR